MSIARNSCTAPLSAADAFRRRMEQQCHEIRRYRQARLRDDGQHLSMEEAALEWIERFAADFARDHRLTAD